ncbi:MAG: hypothetical protein AAFS10_18270 [Myxococcota bacterium]
MTSPLSFDRLSSFWTPAHSAGLLFYLMGEAAGQQQEPEFLQTFVTCLDYCRQLMPAPAGASPTTTRTDAALVMTIAGSLETTDPAVIGRDVVAHMKYIGDRHGNVAFQQVVALMRRLADQDGTPPNDVQQRWINTASFMTFPVPAQMSVSEMRAVILGVSASQLANLWDETTAASTLMMYNMGARLELKLPVAEGSTLALPLERGQGLEVTEVAQGAPLTLATLVLEHVERLAV